MFLTGLGMHNAHSDAACTAFLPCLDVCRQQVRYMRQLSESSRAPLPLADMAFGHLLTAVASGHGDKDCGAIALAVRAAAGLKDPSAETSK